VRLSTLLRCSDNALQPATDQIAVSIALANFVHCHLSACLSLPYMSLP
jgi:hypothetical protein